MEEEKQTEKIEETKSESANTSNDVEKQTEEKKDGKFSNFFKKVSKKFDDATYSMRLQSDFDKNHSKWTVFAGTSVLMRSPEIAAEEHRDENYLNEVYLLTLDDDEEIAAGNLIRSEDDGKVFHIESVEKTTFFVEFEGKKNERDALKIVLGAPAQKVDVIKVGDDFYLKN